MKYLSLFFTVFFGFLTHAQTGTQSTFTMEHDGKTREFILYIPQSYDGQTEVPLVVNLHDYGSSMTDQIQYGDFRKIADTANFILVVPNGLNDEHGNQYWHYYLSSGEDDIGFLSALIEELDNNYAINSNEVHFTGFGTGATMSVHLACFLSDEITSIAMVAGSMPSYPNTCHPVDPVPVMVIHGTNDTILPYHGSLSSSHIENVVAYWVYQTNTNTTPVITQVPNIDATDNCTAEHYLYKNGTNGATVEHYKILGGEHTWPGAIIDIGVTNHDFDASTEIWRFFSQFNSSKLLSAKEESIIDEIVKIYPNPSSGTINIDINQSIEKLEIITTQGQVLRAVNRIDKPLTFTSVKPGIYFIRTQLKGEIFTQKVIVN